MSNVSYEDFAKLDLRVAKIIQTEPIPGKSRIIKGIIDLGDEKREVIIGGGDIILFVDGLEVRKISDILIHLQRAKSVGDEMVLEIIRDGRTTNVTIVLGERPNGE